MRYGIVFMFLLVALIGCATIKTAAREDGMTVNYVGTASGAATLLHATDERPYDLASEAVDKGMSTSLVRDADGDVRFNAGYGYVGYGATSVGGYAPANTGYVPGQGFVTGPPQNSLPPLATSVVATGVPQSQATGGAIVPCPRDRLPQTVAEQSACAAAGVRSLTQNRTK